MQHETTFSTPPAPATPGTRLTTCQRSIRQASHPYHEQCLRILRCTAKALAEGPGGLRFKAGTQPWLEGLARASIPSIP